MSKSSLSYERDVLRFTDILPGLLALPLKLPSFFRMVKAIILILMGKGLASVGAHIENNAKKHPDKVAVFFEDTKLTHKEFNEKINQYANYFLSHGLEKEDVVVVLLENRPEIMMIIAAMAKIGCIASLINNNLRGDALAHSINLTPKKMFIVGEELINSFEDVKGQIDKSNNIPLYFLTDKGDMDVPEGYIDLSIQVQGASVNNPETTSQIKMSDKFAYMFTSGTTGKPKAAIQQHFKWISSSIYLGYLNMNMKPDDITYVAVPLVHNTGLLLGWATAAINGSAIALRRKFSVSNFWMDIRKYNATSFVYIGEICRYLINQPPSKEDKNNPVKKILGVGLRPDIYKDFKKRFDISTVVEFYGSSEGTVIFSNLFNIDCTMGIGLVPYSVVKYDIDIEGPVKDENGFMQKADKGEPGLLIGKLMNADDFNGYTDKKATAEKIFRNVFKEGDTWFNTGDFVRNIGFYHAEFLDRLGDTFRWKGENVSTTEVEEIINTAHYVSGSTVYGVEIPGTDGRVGMVSIIPTDGIDNFDFNNFTGILKQSLPHYAMPIFLRFKKEFETTATYKIKKAGLKKEGFNINNISDPIYVLLPKSTEYCLITNEIYNEILNGSYRF